MNFLLLRANLSYTTLSPLVYSRILVKVWANPGDHHRNNISTPGRSKTDVKSDEKIYSLRRRRVRQNDNVESQKRHATHQAFSLNMIHANSRRIEIRHTSYLAVAL